jgi:hypothetical protein
MSQEVGVESILAGFVDASGHGKRNPNASEAFPIEQASDCLAGEVIPAPRFRF